jgi:fumarate hydratase subunit alpha
MKIFKLDEKIELIHLTLHQRRICLNYEKFIENIIVKLIQLASIKLPKDIKKAIINMYQLESHQIAKTQLKAIIDNIRLAEESNIPICQDTGILSFYIKAGSNFEGLEKVENILCKAVKRATVEIPLRPNTLNPFTQKNSGDNIGRYIPYFYWKIVNGDFLEITVLPKGGGSENVCALKMMKPTDGLICVERFVIDSVTKAGGMPCPPTIIGVGIGGGANIAMDLAKVALLRPLDQHNSDNSVANLERRLYTAVNRTGIGPMGLGGDSTTLAVKVEYASVHPASFPVAIAFQCWAARRASVLIHSNRKVEYLTHKV